MDYNDTRYLIHRKIYWTSKDKKRVIVRGPFPEYFPRTKTRRSLADCINLRGRDAEIWGRSNPGNDGFAKTWARCVKEIHPEWGIYSL